MAFLYVTEFNHVGHEGGDAIQAVLAPPLVDQTPVAVGAGSLSSSAFNANTNLVRLCADTTCSVQFGTAPTATTSTMRIPANTPEYFTVSPGSALKVAVIANS